jgi:hypothetical protein
LRDRYGEKEADCGNPALTLALQKVITSVP